jgi:glycosyltransferase involved in cell wall biosynthesis
MKIAIVVHGRFHAFDLARALLARGHQVTLLTNYPGWAVERFGVARRHVRGFPLHGVLARVAGRLSAATRLPMPDPQLHPLFGRWAAAQLQKEQWDAIHCFSGVAEEILRAPKLANTLRLLVRGSAHIRTQAQLLAEEQRRAATPLDRPSRWMIDREEREYDLAARIVVLSTFARDSFIAQGVPRDKLSLLPLGVRTEAFRPAKHIIEEHCRRIMSGDPLRILFVGALSFRKGLLDIVHILRNLPSGAFQFRLVGPIAPEVKRVIPELRRGAEIGAKQAQADLPEVYAWGDIFIFPTIEDGFAVVLAQAQAAALPILTTTNCAGPDLLAEGETGWVLPIRRPEAFVERLRWCDSHRKELVAMVRRSYAEFRPRDWSDVAADFERICAPKEAQYAAQR